MNFWEKTWNSIVSFFTDNVWQIILFFAVAILGLVVIKIALIILRKVFKKTKFDNTLSHFIVGLLKFVLLMIYIMTLLSIIGIPITSLVAIMTALSLAVALAVQTSLSSLAYGIILIAGKTFKEGEYVEIDGVGGTVERVTMINTRLKTPQGQIISVPHSKTASAVIVNYTKEGKRRMDITVSVSYDSDVEQVKKILTEIYEADERVLKNEGNTIMLKQCSASSIDFNFRAWTSTDDYWDTLAFFNEQIFYKLRENNIKIPYQTIDINLKNLTDKK